MYFLVVRQKFTANVVVGLLGNESSDSNRFTLVTPKPENGVRLQATLGNQNPTGLPVRAVRKENLDETVFMFALFKCRKFDKRRD